MSYHAPSGHCSGRCEQHLAAGSHSWNTGRPFSTEALRLGMTHREKPNLLLVDDRPENLLALEAILDDLEFNIVTADSGKEALRCLLKQDFALILLDVEMPGLDGFATAELIRSRRKTR